MHQNKVQQAHVRRHLPYSRYAPTDYEVVIALTICPRQFENRVMPYADGLEFLPPIWNDSGLEHRLTVAIKSARQGVGSPTPHAPNG